LASTAVSKLALIEIITGEAITTQFVSSLTAARVSERITAAHNPVGTDSLVGVAIIGLSRQTLIHVIAGGS